MVLTDNEYLYENMKEIIDCDEYRDMNFNFYYSDRNIAFNSRYLTNDFKPINVKGKVDEIIAKYQLVLSLHCKQLFPSKLVNSVRCVNIHPGYNPYNRGWFPQVFSIINKLPIGATIHEMDENLDSGNIIVQEKIEILSWETSFDIYNKVQNLEVKLLKQHLHDIIDHSYESIYPKVEGNINLKKDFEALCKIDLDKSITFREAIDYFRAMSFSGYKNAYFIDQEGRKVFIDINLDVVCNDEV
ncbi:dTDP-4-amino-4,6-dideoxyglucose formyltransferase [Psychrobacillus sp. NPDC096426]|uniref:dTDP-4-amino-4,6-dideoxyglucose formyltransferase n=1 Tax=Psychrobacillus sp. NPDC096426 TaxID=3364491 RepID=UPI0038140050